MCDAHVPQCGQQGQSTFRQLFRPQPQLPAASYPTHRPSPCSCHLSPPSHPPHVGSSAPLGPSLCSSVSNPRTDLSCNMDSVLFPNPSPSPSSMQAVLPPLASRSSRPDGEAAAAGMSRRSRRGGAAAAARDGWRGDESCCPDALMGRRNSQQRPGCPPRPLLIHPHPRPTQRLVAEEDPAVSCSSLRKSRNRKSRLRLIPPPNCP